MSKIIINTDELKDALIKDWCDGNNLSVNKIIEIINKIGTKEQVFFTKNESKHKSLGKGIKELIESISENDISDILSSTLDKQISCETYKCYYKNIYHGWLEETICTQFRERINNGGVLILKGEHSEIADKLINIKDKELKVEVNLNSIMSSTNPNWSIVENLFEDYDENMTYRIKEEEEVIEYELISPQDVNKFLSEIQPAYNGRDYQNMLKFITDFSKTLKVYVPDNIFVYKNDDYKFDYNTSVWSEDRKIINIWGDDNQYSKDNEIKSIKKFEISYTHFINGLQNITLSSLIWAKESRLESNKNNDIDSIRDVEGCINDFVNYLNRVLNFPKGSTINLDTCDEIAYWVFNKVGVK